MNAEDPVIELSDDEARDFLASQRFGRLAMVLIDEPEIVPVNFVLSTEGEHGDTIYINTAQGNKLFAAAAGRTLAFEADEVGEEFATSAIAYGNGRIVNTTEEADLAARLGGDLQVFHRRDRYLADERPQVPPRTSTRESRFRGPRLNARGRGSELSNRGGYRRCGQM